VCAIREGCMKALSASNRASRCAAVLWILAICGCRGLPSADQAIEFGPHPRFEHTSAELAQWRTDPARQNEIARATAAGDRLLDKGLVVPDEEGNWIFYYACPDDGARLRAESPERHLCPKCGKAYTDERTQASYRTLLYNQLERDMHALALAYALTGETRYTGPVRDAFLKLARSYPTFTRHDRWGRRGLLAVVGGRRYAQHLDEAVSAILLAKTYDLIAGPVATGDDRVAFLTAEDRNAIEGFLGDTVREIQRYQSFVDRSGINNHITWFNASYAAVGLATGDQALIRDSVHGRHGLLFQLENSVTDEGIWYEGTMAYHFYALQAIMNQLDALNRADWDFSDHRRLKTLWAGPHEVAYPNGRMPAINDGDWANLKQWQRAFDWGAKYFRDPSLALATSPDGPAAPARSKVLTDAGLVILRRGAAANAVMAIMDFGQHGGHHGHPDKLNIMLYALGREWLPDPGRLTYSVPEYETWARTTVAHNTVVIDGRNQKPDHGRLLFFEETDTHAAAICESRGAYPGTVLRRALVLTEAFLVDAYHVTTAADATIDWFVHAAGELTAANCPTGTTQTETNSLGQGQGYQHLENVRQYRCPQQSKWEVSGEGGTLGIHCLDSDGVELFSGTGIGYSLSQRIPFVLRRCRGREALFLTVYGFAPGNPMPIAIRRHASPDEASSLQNVALSLTTGDADWNVRVEFGPKASAGLALAKP